MGATPAPSLRGYLIQILMIIFINVPTVSFGLALGWVSLASGRRETGSDEALVGAAAATFAAGLAGVPLAARALAFGRKPALIATSALFAVCWALKLAGGWGVVAGRVCAGAGGAAAWCVAPLLAGESVSESLRGAAGAAPVLAHNLGFLLMYAAADLQLDHSLVLWCCLTLSVLHCGAFLLAPESPAFLAAGGQDKAARAVLARLRGTHVTDAALEAELAALPAPPGDVAPTSTWQHLRDLFGSRARVRAFVLSAACVVGQECCGVLTLMQFAERVFVEAGAGAARGGAGGVTPARAALLLGGVQLLASVAGLCLIERAGRRALVTWGAVGTGAALAGGAAGVWWGHAGGAALALAAAVAADSAALQPAPYAILTDVFHYQYRGAAVALVTMLASAGNAAETLLFPALTRAGGLELALAVSAALTLLYAALAFVFVPETRGRSVDQIYALLDPRADPPAAPAGDCEAAACDHNGNTKRVPAPAPLQRGAAGARDINSAPHECTTSDVTSSVECAVTAGERTRGGSAGGRECGAGCRDVTGASDDTTRDTSVRITDTVCTKL